MSVCLLVCLFVCLFKYSFYAVYILLLLLLFFLLFFSLFVSLYTWNTLTMSHIYYVQVGDTIYDILLKFGCTPPTNYYGWMKEHNPIIKDINHIEPGWELVVPWTLIPFHHLFLYFHLACISSSDLYTTHKFINSNKSSSPYSLLYHILLYHFFL